MIGRLNRRQFGLRSFAIGASLAANSFRRARAQTTVLKVGILLPRSGFEAQIGQGCQRGFDVAVPILRDMG